MSTVIACKYFPQLPARWHCSDCQVNMSDPCAALAEPLRARDSARLCPICRKPLQSLGIGNTIKPLWERIPKFFLYPAKVDALAYIGIIALLNGLGVLNLIIAILIYLVSLYAILKYAFKCLNHSARGHLEPPGVMVDYAVMHSSLVLRQFGVFLMMGLIVMPFAFLGPKAFIAAFLFMLVSIPASTMVLAIEGSMLAAVNPAKLIAIMSAVGRSYWILYFFLLMLSGGHEWLSGWAMNTFPTALVLPAEVFLVGYFTIVMYAMMGYLIYQHHEQLGFEDVKEFGEENKTPVPGLEDEPFLNEISVLIKEGLLEEALSRMKSRMKQGASAKEHDKYHKLLKLAGDKAELAEHGQLFIRRLLSEEDQSQKRAQRDALEIYGDCIKSDRNFYYPDAEVVYRLAELARQFGMNDLALALVNQYKERFPDSQRIPEAYFLAAQLLAEHKQKDQAAKQLLLFLIKDYPDHPLNPDIKNYLLLLMDLQAKMPTSAP